VRWWDGVAWTQHVALPEEEPEADVVFLDVARAPIAQKIDDGELHPRARDDVFAGAVRGPIAPPRERLRINGSVLLSLQGAQLAGAAALTLLSWWIVVNGFLHMGGMWTGVRVGVFAALGVLIPVTIRISRRAFARSEFWWHWCATRGFEPGAAEGPGRVLPKLLGRSPLLGATEGRVFEHVARRRIAGREAAIGVLLRVLPLDGDPDTSPLSTRDTCRFAFMVMPMPEQAAARWKGASIRADHHATRPMHLRALLGALVPAAIPECRAHLASAPEQDPAMLQRLVDSRLERYLATHPLDVDIVDDLLVVTRDGDPYDHDLLDELARDTLVLHELLVAEHELPQVAEPESSIAMPPEDEPAIDPSREGWGEGNVDGDSQYREAA
jgi:hypothetical protein